mgnify:CR=1 FL=1|jgi:hypothetical protein
MSNEQTQKELELEIMELEDKLAYKKDQLERLEFINSSGRYFLDSGGSVIELVPTANDLEWEKAIKQGNTFKTIKDALKEKDRRALLYEFNQYKNEQNNEWAPNWTDYDEPKFYITFNGTEELTPSFMYTLQNFVTFGYFRDYRACFDAIMKFGDRIKKLYID